MNRTNTNAATGVVSSRLGSAIPKTTAVTVLMKRTVGSPTLARSACLLSSPAELTTSASRRVSTAMATTIASTTLMSLDVVSYYILSVAITL